MFTKNRRILVIDDNRAIHDDLRKLLGPRNSSPLSAMEHALFGDEPPVLESFELDSAYQGQEGVAMARAAREAGKPYALAIVDMRIPPGWDGLETIERLWEFETEIQVVICTAYSDSTWQDILARFGSTDRLLVLKKPFDMAEMCQLASTLTEKWRLSRQARFARGELAKSLALARGVHEAMIDGLLVVDSNGKIATTNRRFAEMWNIPDEIVSSGDDQRLLDHVIHNLVDPDEFLARVQHLYENPTEVSCEEIRLKSGAVFERRTGPVHGEDGTAYGRLWCFRDITERKKIEADRAVLTERMTSMGRLAASVGHEINNPLAYAIGNIDWMTDVLRTHRDNLTALPIHELADTVNTTRSGLARIAVIVRDLQTLSRADDQSQTDVNIEEVLEQAIQIASNEVRHRAKIVRRYAAAPRVVGNEARLGQVFLNLLVNAAHAIAEGHVNENQIQLAIFERDQCAVIEISDTGTGIDDKHLERIFDPFFTTKEIGTGTGLGLSICKGIVESHQGSISVKSTLGAGTTFTVTLPGTSAAETRPAVTNTIELVSTQRARILIIDDEAHIGQAITRLIRDRHDVVSTTLASEGLQRIESGEMFDVILCDLMMSDMSGMDVHSRIQRARPDLADRMVFMTGGAFTSGAVTFLATVQNDRLSKPFSRTELTNTIVRNAARVAR